MATPSTQRRDATPAEIEAKPPARSPFAAFLDDDLGVVPYDTRPGEAARETAAAVAAKPVGPDLAGKRKVVFLAGPGNSGKSTLALFVVDEAVQAGREIVVIDADRVNPTLTNRIPHIVARAPATSDEALRGWLSRTVFDRLGSLPADVLIDVAGGDLSLVALRRLIDLRTLFDEAGVALVVLYPITPRVDDLAVLIQQQEAGLQAHATALLLNEFRVPGDQTVERAYAQVQAHPAFLRAVAEGAAVIRLPTLVPAAAVEARGITLDEAASGEEVRREDGRIVPPLGPIDRGMVRQWQELTRTALAPIASWMPGTPLA